MLVVEVAAPAVYFPGKFEGDAHTHVKRPTLVSALCFTVSTTDFLSTIPPRIYSPVVAIIYSIGQNTLILFECKLCEKYFVP